MRSERFRANSSFMFMHFLGFEIQLDKPFPDKYASSQDFHSSWNVKREIFVEKQMFCSQPFIYNMQLCWWWPRLHR